MDTEIDYTVIIDHTHVDGLKLWVAFALSDPNAIRFGFPKVLANEAKNGALVNEVRELGLDKSDKFLSSLQFKVFKQFVMQRERDMVIADVYVAYRFTITGEILTIQRSELDQFSIDFVRIEETKHDSVLYVIGLVPKL